MKLILTLATTLLAFPVKKEITEKRNSDICKFLSQQIRFPGIGHTPDGNPDGSIALSRLFNEYVNQCTEGANKLPASDSNQNSNLQHASHN